jgi:hypothetical protein
MSALKYLRMQSVYDMKKRLMDLAMQSTQEQMTLIFDPWVYYGEDSTGLLQHDLLQRAVKLHLAQG